MEFSAFLVQRNSSEQDLHEKDKIKENHILPPKLLCNIQYNHKFLENLIIYLSLFSGLNLIFFYDNVYVFRLK